MNWDTKETWNWIVDNEAHMNYFKSFIGNELQFMYHLFDFILYLNVNNDCEIEMKEVNGNEIYVDFCELNGNETDGWK